MLFFVSSQLLACTRFEEGTRALHEAVANATNASDDEARRVGDLEHAHHQLASEVAAQAESTTARVEALQSGLAEVCSFSL